MHGKGFIDSSQTIDNVYENLDYNPINWWHDSRYRI